MRHDKGLANAGRLRRGPAIRSEGGMAAALGNVSPKDNWKVHFRDTLRGGKFLNVWRMAELHA
jgi:succinate dehydrogenase / fumarate reductase flavoprotein subunit